MQGLNLNEKQRQHNLSKQYSTDTYGLNFGNFEKQLIAYRRRGMSCLKSPLGFVNLLQRY